MSGTYQVTHGEYRSHPCWSDDEAITLAVRRSRKSPADHVVVWTLGHRVATVVGGLVRRHPWRDVSGTRDP